MERLTEKTKDCFGYSLKDRSDAEIGFFKNYDCFYSHMMVVRKLGEYEDLEEQGLLLRLPCKVNDIVYHIAFNYKTTRKEKIVETRFSLEMLEDYKKWWFLTKAEAEKKLAEMGE